jgi:hypothetical protein
MIIHKSLKRLVLVLAAGLFLMLTYQIVGAACCKTITDPFAGSTAYSSKTITTLSSVAWKAEVISAMGSPYGALPVIDVIGWTQWDVVEKCGVYTVEYTVRGPDYGTNKGYRAGNFQQALETCTLEHVLGNKGNHNYQEAGNSINRSVYHTALK